MTPPFPSTNAKQQILVAGVLHSGWHAKQRLQREKQLETHKLSKVETTQRSKKCAVETGIWPCLVPKKFCKIFQISRHIESLDTCMEY
jgi:hypothetical protein